jgi:hypothetical protein
LNIISQRIGGIRIGLFDETADKKDRQARELWNRCGTGESYGSMAPNTSMFMNSIISCHSCTLLTLTVVVLGAGVEFGALLGFCLLRECFCFCFMFANK